MENLQPIPRDAYRDTGVSRRAFLQILSAAALSQLITACRTSQPSERTVSSEYRIRRAVGEWTPQDTQSLAESMRKETLINDIAYAGSVLSDNISGKPSFSKMSPLFMDDRLKLVTVKPAATNSDNNAPMTSFIEEVEPKVSVTLKSTSPNAPNISISSQDTRLRFATLTINAATMSGYSDFLFKFYIAKEILNVKAFDMVAQDMAEPLLNAHVMSPNTDAAKRAVLLFGLKGGVAEMPASIMADLWAHFLLIPAYLIAIEQERFSPEDLGDGGKALNIFKTPAQIFRTEGILTKNPQGLWKWTTDYNRFFTTWRNVALIAYRAGVTQ